MGSEHGAEMSGKIGIITESIDLYASMEQTLRNQGFQVEYIKHITRDSLNLDAILWEVEPSTLQEGGRLRRLMPALTPLPVLGFSREPLPDSTLVACLEVGMHDYIEGALSRERVLVARIRSAMKNRGIVAPANDRRDSVVVLNQRDPITGLYSREQFLKYMETMVQKCTENGQHATVAVIHLKDTLMLEAQYGAGGVNTYLRLTARALLSVARGSDWIGRLSSDRFAIALPKCTSSLAMGALERLTSTLDSVPYPFPLPVDGKPQLNIGIAGTDRGVRGTELLEGALEMVAQTLTPEQPTVLVHSGPRSRRDAV